MEEREYDRKFETQRNPRGAQSLRLAARGDFLEIGEILARLACFAPQLRDRLPGGKMRDLLRDLALDRENLLQSFRDFVFTRHFETTSNGDTIRNGFQYPRTRFASCILTSRFTFAKCLKFQDRRISISWTVA